MEREPIPQLTFSGSLIAIGAIFLYLINAIPGMEYDVSEALQFIIAIGISSLIIGTLISQLVISLWSIICGFSKIDFSKDLEGDKFLVQIIFDKYMHGCNLENCNKDKDYLCKSARNYCRRRVSLYWLHLISIHTSILIVITGTIMIFVSDLPCIKLAIYSLILFVFYGFIVIINFLHKKRAARELYNMGKIHLDKDKMQQEINDLEKHKTE